MEIAAEKDFSQPQKSVVVRLLRRGKSANQKPYRQQDSAYSWLVCISGLLANALILGVSYSYGVLFPVFLKEFQEGKAKTGKSDNIKIKLMSWIHRDRTKTLGHHGT